jgi:DNA-3-methyladenine glycosylase
MKLSQSFFAKDAPDLAEALLGCKLVHKTPEGITSGIIVETEAYSQEDAASHSARGETPRTKVMFGPPGFAYVYFTYGMHYCFNVVSSREGHGSGVLIRALEPVEGIELMKERRNKENLQELCNGPAKLVQAMGITLKDYGKPLFKGDLYVEESVKTDVKIAVGQRIGISQAIDVPWRFWNENSPFVSRKS